MKLSILAAMLIVTTALKAQNLFAVKLNNCNTESFCLDCGDQPATVDAVKFAELLAEMNVSSNLQGIAGIIEVQVLVEADASACVLSHTDRTHNKITTLLIKKLNHFQGWIPAITEGKVEERTSINMIFEIKNGTITGKVNRVDVAAFEASFDRPRDPEIFNKKYAYLNEHLKEYTITVWNSANSDLKDNRNDKIALDTSGVVWITVDEGLFKLEKGSILTAADSFPYKNVVALEIDNHNTVWISTYEAIFSFSAGQWQKHPKEETGVAEIFDIVNNPLTGEMYFCSNEGLAIYKDGIWRNLTKRVVPELPSKSVYYAKKDSRNRIWIGTFEGSIMIDEKGKVTHFNVSDTPLKKRCITSMTEDENGNLYFGLYEYDAKDKSMPNRDEGIAVYHPNAEWEQLTTGNSGMPFNNTSAILYDPFEKVLWIATDRAGLVRCDLKGGWENYHNQNSELPTSEVYDIIQDKSGALFVGTGQGLVKIVKK